jgi:hypothetical protein
VGEGEGGVREEMGRATRRKMERNAGLGSQSVVGGMGLERATGEGCSTARDENESNTNGYH